MLLLSAIILYWLTASSLHKAILNINKNTWQFWSRARSSFLQGNNFCLWSICISNKTYNLYLRSSNIDRANLAQFSFACPYQPSSTLSSWFHTWSICNRLALCSILLPCDSCCSLCEILEFENFSWVTCTFHPRGHSHTCCWCHWSQLSRWIPWFPWTSLYILCKLGSRVEKSSFSTFFMFRIKIRCFPINLWTPK